MVLTPNQVSSAVMYDLSRTNLHLSADMSGTDVASVAASLQIVNLFKKLEPVDSSARQKTEEAAITRFLQVNEENITSLASVSDVTKRVLHHARLFWHDLFPENRFLDIKPSSGSFGPGSVLFAGSNMSDKLYGRVGYTSVVARNFWLRAALSEPVSRSAEIMRIKDFGFDRVNYGNLTTVPKNDKTDRVICVEPTANAYLQQGIRKYLEAVLKRIGIDLSKQQDIQRMMARQGSVTGNLATIDLSSASDTISMCLCEHLLPADLMAWLMEARTPCVRYKGTLIELTMMGTMGNATTFPLQTLLFASLVHGVYVELGMPCNFKSQTVFDKVSRRFRHVQRNAGVFGDDIIIVTEAYELLASVFKDLGLRINPEKSFHNGFFRESCGGDYFMGRNVRSAYIKSLSTRNDLFVAYNILRRWSRRVGVPIPTVLRLIRSAVKKPLFVPSWENDDAGFHCDDGPKAYVASVARNKHRVHKRYTEAVICLLYAGRARQETVDQEKIDSGLVTALEPIRPYRSEQIVYRDKKRIAFSYTVPPFELHDLPFLTKGGNTE